MFQLPLAAPVIAGIALWTMINFAPDATNSTPNANQTNSAVQQPGDARPGPGNYQSVEIEVASTADGAKQRCRLNIPQGYNSNGPSVPLVVLLHSWSADYRQANPVLERLAAVNGWLCLRPDFRGPNQHPEACGSALAQQDILDALDFVLQNYRVDQERVYLCGASGGGHMTMMMAARHPKRWRAASAWVGISDLTAWHARHANSRYGEMMRKSCGGRPGESEAIDAEYRNRSPIHFLDGVGNLPLDLAAGIHDGHQGSVPISHTLNAFNVIAQSHKAKMISPEEMNQLSQKNGRLAQPQPGDEMRDDAWERDIYLRRQAGNTRVSIFEGGHEGIAEAMMAWFLEHGGKR